MVLSDTAYMDHALCLAARGRGRTSPNPMVGAVVVSPDGVVVGSGYHHRAGEPHAEVHALAAAGPAARGATLFSNLEPCCHTGRTGPCVARIVDAGMARVVVGVEDPNPLVHGGGIRYLHEHRVRVDVGIRRRAAERLNEAVFTHLRRHRPFVTMKVAMSLDGRIATGAGSCAITSLPATRQVHGLRAEVDAVGVGSGTILADDPRLTAREVCRERPLTRVVFDTRLRTPPAATVFSTLDAGPVLIMTTDEAARTSPIAVAALTAAGATIERLLDRDFRAAFERLGALGLTSLLLEGGTTLHQAAWSAGLVDRVQLYVAPFTLGRTGVAWLDAQTFTVASLRDVRVESCGCDMFVEGYVHRAD